MGERVRLVVELTDHASDNAEAIDWAKVADAFFSALVDDCLPGLLPEGVSVDGVEVARQ